MRRVARWTLSAATALSLLLCTATAALWVRSYHVFDCAYVVRHQTLAWLLESEWGRVSVTYGDWSGSPVKPKMTGFRYYHPYPPRPRKHDRPDPPGITLHWRWLGLDIARGVPAGPGPSGEGIAAPFVDITVPHWFVVSAAGVLPFMRLFGFARRRRSLPEGRCRSCQYDLTGNVSGVCPECGEAVQEAKRD